MLPGEDIDEIDLPPPVRIPLPAERAARFPVLPSEWLSYYESLPEGRDKQWVWREHQDLIKLGVEARIFQAQINATARKQAAADSSPGPLTVGLEKLPPGPMRRIYFQRNEAGIKKEAQERVFEIQRAHGKEQTL